MNPRRAIVVGLIAAALAPAAAARPVACDVLLNVTDQSPEGVAVRARPAGRVLAVLKAEDRWVQVHATGQSGAWAIIDRADTYDDTVAPAFQGRGYVQLPKLGIEELNQQGAVLASPSDAAPAVIKLTRTDSPPGAEVIGCSGRFLHVRVGHVTGWTRDYCTDACG
jgi:hypothetical protein